MSELWNLVNWNHHEKCIQISTNMPDIGLEVCELRISDTKLFCIDGETNGHVQSIFKHLIFHLFLFQNLPFVGPIPGGISVGKTIQVKGQIDKNATK